LQNKGEFGEMGILISYEKLRLAEKVGIERGSRYNFAECTYKSIVGTIFRN
jgi:hypothetical protein